MTTHDLNAENVFRALREHCLYMPPAALRAALDRAEEVVAIRRFACVDADVYFILAMTEGLSTGTALNVLRKLREELLPQPVVKTPSLTIYGIREQDAGAREFQALLRAADALGGVA